MSFCLRLVFWLVLEIGFLRKFRCRIFGEWEFLASVWEGKEGVRKKSADGSELLSCYILSNSDKRVRWFSGRRILEFWCFFELGNSTFMEWVEWAYGGLVVFFALFTNYFFTLKGTAYGYLLLYPQGVRSLCVSRASFVPNKANLCCVKGCKS